MSKLKANGVNHAISSTVRSTVQSTMQATLPCACGARRLHHDALNIRIDVDGKWIYNNSPIEREAMVRLFASMLKLDGKGRHWLVTPTEMGRIQVDDAPFIAVDMVATGSGEDQTLRFSTNIETVVCVTKDTPITMKPSPATGRLTPYVSLGDGLQAKITRAVYYELVELCVAKEVNGQTLYGLWSSSTFFPLGDVLFADEDLNA